MSWLVLLLLLLSCLQCFDAVGWAAGRASGLYKTEWWGAGMVICLERGADLHIAQLMPLSFTFSCFSKIQIGFTFLVAVHPGSPVQRVIKQMCVCACVVVVKFPSNEFLVYTCRNCVGVLQMDSFMGGLGLNAFSASTVQTSKSGPSTCNGAASNATSSPARTASSVS